MGKRLFASLVLLLLASCVGEPGVVDGSGQFLSGNGAKADDGTGRHYEVVLTNPHCDICDGADKSYLKPRSNITARVVELIDNAQHSVDAAQFTFSVTDIEAALLRAHQRGVAVRLAMNEAQKDQGDNVSNRLLSSGLNVRFIAGKVVPSGGYSGLMHSKFMLVDENVLVHGSNNWSSTGTSINEENTLIIQAPSGDPLTQAFACHFRSLWESRIDDSVRCSTEEATFTPGTAAIGMLKTALRDATYSVDVLMHHLLFDQLLKELAKAAERGIKVRVIVNANDRHETQGSKWDRLRTAGGEIRYKQTNADMYQIMHHKLVIVDGSILINGSGNWSGSAFFNNYEFYVRYTSGAVLKPFVDLFARLWQWSLSATSLDAGRTAAQQHVAETQIFFGNLHAHYASHDEEHLLDDGKLERTDSHGHAVDVAADFDHGDPARYAYEYARDRGGMDFMALTPHVADDDPSVPANQPNMSRSGYQHLMELAETVTDQSGGAFVALPGMEWNTNSAGNHMTVLGSSQLCKVLRGRFDLFYEDYLGGLKEAGESPFLVFNHPRTFRKQTTYLKGNWDQIYGINLTEIPNDSDRNKKFNDYGLDDYPPLNQVLGQWISGDVMPDAAVVSQTLQTIEQVSRPYGRLMAVTVGRGNDISHEQGQNPSLTEHDDGTITRHTRVHSDWDYYLSHGFKLAPTSPQDNHFANWGAGHSNRTAMIAPALTEEHLMNAIDQRAVYASEDQNMRVRFYADNRIPMGSSMTTLANSVTLNALVADPDHSGAFDVSVWQGTVGNPEVKQVSSTLATRDEWTAIDVTLDGPGTHFVYLEIHAPGPNRMAWTAPIWIERPAL